MKQIIIISLLFLAACTKQVQQQRIGGALPDDEQEIAKVPLIVSSSFINKIAAKGKPVTNITFLSPIDQSTVIGTVLIKTSVTSNIYIDGSQVSSIGSYNWNTANAASGYHILTAQVKATKVSITVFIETTVIDPPTPSTEVSLLTPIPMNQGGEGSCVAFAVGYAARSIEQYYRTGAASYSNSVNVFSPEFLYNQIKFSADCGSGTAMQTALDFIVTNGICTYQSMPSVSGCSLLPTASQSAEALNYKIASYSKLYCSDKVAIKSMIDNHHPVIINVVTDYAFNGATAGFIWNVFKDEWVTPHCIVIVGYDDSKNAYKIMNSWGTTWGDAGFGWIDYDLFPQRSGTYCYVMN